MLLQDGTNHSFMTKALFCIHKWAWHCEKQEGLHHLQISSGRWIPGLRIKECLSKIRGKGEKTVYEKKQEKTCIILLYVFSGKHFGTNNLFLKVICRELHLQC